MDVNASTPGHTPQHCFQKVAMGVSIYSAHLAVMLISVEHDSGVSQDVDYIRILEEVRALHVVACPKALHDPVDLLGLAR